MAVAPPKTLMAPKMQWKKKKKKEIETAKTMKVKHQAYLQLLNIMQA